MGAEAKTILRVGARSYAGTALLESDALLFRGEHRLRVPLGDIADVRVTGDVLRLEHPGGVAELALGAKTASAWEKKIRNPPTVADKLGVKQGMRVALLDVDDGALRDAIVVRGATLESAVREDTAMVLLRVTTPEQLAALELIAGRMARDAAIWVLHPRGVREVADTVIFAAGRKAGLVATKVARVSETDTAEKLVIPAAAR